MKQHYMVNRTDGIGLHASPAHAARTGDSGAAAPGREAPGSAGAVPGRSALAGGSVHLMVTLERAE